MMDSNGPAEGTKTWSNFDDDSAHPGPHLQVVFPVLVYTLSLLTNTGSYPGAVQCR